MKYEYIKNGKLNYNGNQYRKGAIFDLESLGQLPENWFKKVKEKKVKKIKIEKIEDIEKIEVNERVEKKVVKTKPKNKEVIDYGNNTNTN